MFLLWLWYMMSWIAAVVMARLCWRGTRPQALRRCTWGSARIREFENPGYSALWAEQETRDYPTGYLRAPAGAVQYDRESRTAR